MSSKYDRAAQRHFITSDDVRAASLRGETAITVCENSTVTDEARELAMKLGLLLDVSGQARPPLSAARTGATPPATAARATAGAAMPALPEDAGRRVADAIAAVLDELKLGGRAAQLAPVLTRRVFASLDRAAKGG